MGHLRTRRQPERNDRGVRALLIGVGLAVTLPGSGVAQVGHSPESSPYNDLRISQTVTLMSGYLSGGRGKAGVGPSDGLLGGVRWDIHVGGAASLFLGGYMFDLERRVLDPTQPPETRMLGTASQSVIMVDGGVNLILTGEKTWHGFAPYVGANLGVVFGGEVPEDSSGFRFATKFHAGPALGIRLFVNRRFHLRVEARNVLWRITYPNSFFAPPENAPGADPILNEVDTSNTQWTHHPVLMFGLGYTLRL